MSDYYERNARQHGALRGAAEWARDALNGKIAHLFPDRETAIKSALFSLQRALDHDGSEDYFDRLQQLRDSVAKCDAERTV
jgi:hypothetical protein